MISYSQRLYLGNSISEKKLRRIKRYIRHGNGQVGLYVISLSENEHNQLDITNIVMFKQRFYRKFNIRIVGIVSSYDEAVDTVMSILDETLEKTGTVDMKSYLTNEFKKKG